MTYDDKNIAEASWLVKQNDIMKTGNDSPYYLLKFICDLYVMQRNIVMTTLS